MRVLLQRVNHAAVQVEGKCVGAIEKGLAALVGFGPEDSPSVLRPMLEKIVQLRIFPDEQGRFQHSLQDIRGALLLVPQFTLYADLSRGRRPDFGKALAPTPASALFEQLCIEARMFSLTNVQTGIFGAHMQVSLENDGPVTLWLEL